MSTWRHRAIEIAPELKTEFQDPELSPFTVFMELLSVLEQAHDTNNRDRLQKIYDYAEWCLRQKDKKLWNAAGVSFYEHLGDSNKTFPAFTHWVKRDVYVEIRELLALRLEESKMDTLDMFYGLKKDK